MQARRREREDAARARRRRDHAPRLRPPFDKARHADEIREKLSQGLGHLLQPQEAAV
jgi:hypothetical protein